MERIVRWDRRKKSYAVEPGEIELQIGASSADIRLKESMTVE
jgi:hypothetical protein